METIRIKSTDEASQGPFVVIDAANFDPDLHERFDPEPTKPLGIAALRDALTAKGIAFDADAKKADLQALLDGAPK
jgi:hypothetical protein